MTILSIDIPTLPKAIRDSIIELSKDITVEKKVSAGWRHANAFGEKYLEE